MDAFTKDEPLRDALLKHPETVSETELDAMLDPSSYLGISETFVDRVLASLDI